jgi:hypothetical protein
MARLYFRIGLTLCSLLMALMLLIQAQPYQDKAVRRLLLPEGCAVPCFMGIRPGVTTVTDMVHLLQNSGWVNPADISVNSRFNVIRLEWRWNGQQPALLRGGAQAVATILPGFNQEPTLGEPERVITGLSINTAIRYGDVRLMLGSGANKADYIVSNNYINPRITAVYTEYGLVALSPLMPCPVSLTAFWNSSVILQIGYTFVDDIVHVCRGVQ